MKSGVNSLFFSSPLDFMAAVPLRLRGNTNERFMRSTETHPRPALTPWESWFRLVECVVVIDSVVINKLHLAGGGAAGIKPPVI